MIYRRRGGGGEEEEEAKEKKKGRKRKFGEIKVKIKEGGYIGGRGGGG